MERRSWTVSFEDGEKNVLSIVVEKRRDGSARTFVFHRCGKLRTRGATQKHADLAAAEAVQKTLAAKALKDGWRAREVRPFGPRPDAFDAAGLPKPKSSSKKAAA